MPKLRIFTALALLGLLAFGFACLDHRGTTEFQAASGFESP
jgi:hypothetical protein